MKSFNITVPDNKESLFLEWMKSISFVKKIEVVSDIDIPEDQKKIVRRRLKQIEEHPENSLTWEDIENKIKL